MAHVKNLPQFVGAISRRTVDVPDLGRFLLRAPTVREALTTYALLGFFDQDEEARDELLQLWADWMPARLLKGIVHAAPLDRLAALLFLLDASPDAGAKEPDAKEDAEDEPGGVRWVRERDWWLVIGEFIHVYGMPFDSVLAMAWPIFINLLEKLDVIRAIDQVFNMGWYASAKTGKPEGIYAMAGLHQEAMVPLDDYMTDEWQEEQMRQADKIIEFMQQRNRRQARA